MASSMLPPVIFTLRANATQFLGSMKTARAELAKTDAAGEAAGGSLAARAAKYSGVVAKATTVAALAVGVESVRMAADFQKQMTLLQTAGGETAANIKTVSAGILNLAQATGTSTSQLAEGMYTVEKAGIRGADGLLVLKAAAEGAKAENVDLGTATNALTSIMMSYHLSAKQATATENMLVVGAGKAKTTMQNYAGSLSTVVPIASAAGIGFAQVAGAIATLTQHGTSADEATQELANTIRNLQAPNQVAMKSMQQLGLNVNDISTKLGTRGLTGTIDLITNAISSKLGPSGLVAVNAFKQSQSASADLQVMLKKMPASLAAISAQYLGGKMSLTEYRKATRGLGADGATMGAQFMALVGKAKGFNDLLKAGSPQAATFAAYLKQVMGGATGLNTALQLGGENMAYFSAATADVAKAGKQTGANISTWAKTQATLSVQLSKAKEMVQVLAIEIGTKLIPPVTAAVAWMTKHRQVVLDVIVGLAALAAVITTVRIALAVGHAAMMAWTVVTKLAAAAQWLFNAAVDANPVVLIVAGIVALGVAVYEAYQHFAPFRNAVDAVGRALRTVWTAVLRPVVDFLARNWKNAIAVAVAVLAPFLLAPVLIAEHWSKVTAFFARMWDGLVSGVKAGVGAFVGFFTALPGELLDMLKDAGSWLLGIGADIIKGLLAGLYAEWVAAPRAIYRFVVSHGGLLGIGETILTTMLHGLQIAWRAVMSFFQALPGRILGALSAAGSWLLKVGENVLTGMLHGIETGWKNEVAFWTALPGRVVGFFRAAGSWLLKIGEAVIRGLTTGITTAAKALYTWFVRLPAAILSKLPGAARWLYNTGRNIITGAYNGIVSAARAFWMWIGSLPSEIKNILSDAGSWLYNIGRDIIGGLINGVKSMGSSAVHAVTGVGGSIVSGVKSFFGIGSPSKLMADQIGQWIPRGIAVGMTADTSSVTTAIKSLGNLIADTKIIGVGAAAAREPGTLGGLAAGELGVGYGPGMVAAPPAAQAASGGGNLTIAVQGSILDLDGLFAAMRKDPKAAAALQAVFLRHGGVNSQTYQPFKRS